MRTLNLLLDLLGAYGLPVSRLHYADTSDQAVTAADSAGYPVVMKIAVEGISHKSDMGGILLGLESRDDVIDGFEQLKKDPSIHPAHQGDFGVHIQKMIPKGQEVIVGVVRDPIFGPLVMFGSGGTDVEGYERCGLCVSAALEIGAGASWWKVHGREENCMDTGNIPPADIEAVKDILVRVAQVMLDLAEDQRNRDQSSDRAGGRHG